MNSKKDNTIFSIVSGTNGGFMNIIIGADLVPTKSNFEHFKKGNIMRWLVFKH